MIAFFRRAWRDFTRAVCPHDFVINRDVEMYKGVGLRGIICQECGRMEYILGDEWVTRDELIDWIDKLPEWKPLVIDPKHPPTMFHEPSILADTPARIRDRIINHPDGCQCSDCWWNRR